MRPSQTKAVGALLRAIDTYHGTYVTKSAMRLAPLVFVRPGELRHAEWVELDLDTAEWNIPADKMKMGLSHLVPLSTQAMAILGDLHALTGRSRYLFPSARSPRRPMSNNTILAALRRMDCAKDEMSGHGFRAMARTILDETLRFRPDYIEHQLAHAVRDPNGRAYNRTAHLAERRKMMQAWATHAPKQTICGAEPEETAPSSAARHGDNRRAGIPVSTLALVGVVFTVRTGARLSIVEAFAIEYTRFPPTKSSVPRHK